MKIARKTRQFRFTIVASGMNPDADDFEDRFFEAGCDDATISFSRGAILLDFDREAVSFAHALVAAINDVETAGATVDGAEPDILVSLSDIAERAALTRAAISLYSKGERGADFPRPVARVSSDSPLWDWVAVSRWLFRRGTVSRTDVVEARVLKAVNAWIGMRAPKRPAIAA